MDDRSSRLILFISGALLIPVGLYLFFNALSSHPYRVTQDAYLFIIGFFLFIFGIGLIISFRDFRNYRKF